MARQAETKHYLINFVTMNKDNEIIFRNSLASLQEKNVILKAYNIPKEDEKVNVLEIPFAKMFDINYAKASLEFGEELFNAYPFYCMINGVLAPIRTISKHFNSLDDAYREYCKIIKFDNALHNHIIELINWAKENSNILCCSLSSFIINHFWETLEAVRNGDEGNYNFDAIRML